MYRTDEVIFFLFLIDSPDNTKLVSISKDRRAIVWDVKKGKKHAEMGWDAPNGIIYAYKRIRFGPNCAT
jgi:hypothetical protein